MNQRTSVMIYNTLKQLEMELNRNTIPTKALPNLRITTLTRIPLSPNRMATFTVHTSYLMQIMINYSFIPQMMKFFITNQTCMMSPSKNHSRCFATLTIYMHLYSNTCRVLILYCIHMQLFYLFDLLISNGYLGKKFKDNESWANKINLTFKIKPNKCTTANNNYLNIQVVFCHTLLMGIYSVKHQ